MSVKHTMQLCFYMDGDFFPQKTEIHRQKKISVKEALQNYGGRLLLLYLSNTQWKTLGINYLCVASVENIAEEWVCYTEESYESGQPTHVYAFQNLHNGSGSNWL